MENSNHGPWKEEAKSKAHPESTREDVVLAQKQMGTY